MNPIRRIAVSAYIPPNSKYETLVSDITSFINAYKSKPLRSVVKTDRRKLMVFLCGNGDHLGFYSCSTKDMQQPIRLPANWWRLDESKEVHVLAMCCSSYEYLVKRGAMRYISSAIAHEGEFRLPTRRETSMRYWVRFYKGLYRILGTQERLTEEGYSCVRDYYTKAMFKGASLKAWGLGGRILSHVTRCPPHVVRLYLLRQFKRLRPIRGRA